jgi:antitoxin component YwqK of YwqJK toxin-antitoxin module
MRHGKGKFFYQDGGLYDGDWVCNKMTGFGRLYYQSGKLAYEGNWL